MIKGYAVALKGSWRNIAFFKTKKEAQKYIDWNKRRMANMEIRKVIG